MMKVHEKLEHLTPEQLDDLINRYQDSDDKVADLLVEFNVDARPSSLVSLFPPILHENLFCPYCEGINLISKRQGRTTYSYGSKSPSCPECGHQDTQGCWCQGCKAKADFARKEKEQRKREIIEAEYVREIEAPAIDDITLTDAVYLLALTRHSLTENLIFIEPFDDNEIPLAPL